MNTKRIYSIVTFLLLFMAGMQAQETNKLYIPDVNAAGGKEFMLPVCMDNVNTRITAFQFTVKVPEGIDVSRWTSGTLTGRMSSTHRIAVSGSKDNLWTVMVYSPDNTPITGSTGILINLPTTVADSISEGSSLPLQMSGVVLSDSLGNNVLTEYECGAVNVMTKLVIGTSKDIVREGDTFRLTITGKFAPRENLTIGIACNQAEKFSFPETVTLESDKTTVSLDVTILDDSEPNDTINATFTATAEGYLEGLTEIKIAPDDIPELELELNPATVSEADGLSAIVGTVRRKGSTQGSITVSLSDDSKGLLYIPSKRITIQAGQATAEFTVGVTDDGLADGSKQFTITAAALLPDCNCTAQAEGSGKATATITVTDNDEPNIRVTSGSTNIKEGDHATLAITLNTTGHSDVRISLSSDADDMLEYDHDITIPAGNTSTYVTVTAHINDSEDEDRIVTFNVSAEDYKSGRCQMLLTEAAPDASIVSVEITPDRAEVGQTATATITMRNSGKAVLPPLTRVNVYLEGVSEELTHVYTTDTLSVGSDVTLSASFAFPQQTGDYALYAIVNEDRAVREITYANNTSEGVSISVLPPFTATAQTDRTIYAQGDTIIVTGKVTGFQAINAPVEVYLINSLSRYSVTVRTDEDGNYTASYALQKNQGGHFSIGACYPGEGLTEEMASCDIYCLTVEAPDACQINTGETYKGTFIISNPTRLEQTGLTIQLGATSPNCSFSFDDIERIDGEGELTVHFTITSTGDITEGGDWQRMPVKVTTSEGSVAGLTICYYVQSIDAVLTCNPQKIETTMTSGEYRDYPVTIRNIGKAETGKITLALPEWMKPMTGREMASLASGDSATIVLRLSPLESMRVGVPVLGHLGINSENASGLRVDFSIIPVSEKKGRLKVDVVDEFTFNTTEAPHVANADIVVKQPATGEVVASGTSDENGTFSLEIEEGQYELSVTADGHEDFSGTVTVDPGTEKTREVFISCEAVTYAFDVIPTEIEDQYQIETVVKYDVRVPKPILLVQLGVDERPQAGDIIPITVTNKGYINAIDVGVVLASSNSSYSIDFLGGEPHLDTLAAGQTEVFFARLTSTATGAKSVSERPSDYECERIGAKVWGYYECGEYYPDNEVSGEDLRLYGECFGSGLRGWGGGFSAWGGYGGGGGPWTSNKSPIDSRWWQTDDGDFMQKVCDKRYPYDPTNPNNPNAPNDPINLGTLPEGEPGRIDCDEDNETAIFMYKLIPTEGTRYIVKGVAADGKAQVKIALDPESKIPEEDCEKYEFDKWYIKQDPEGRDSVKWGKIKGSSFEDATYTAPGIFSSQSSSSVTVQAIMKYIYRSKELTDVREVPVEIEIIRAPVVFVHGLGDSNTCWAKLDTALVLRNYYKPNINYRADYQKTNTSAFFRNVPVVYSSLLKARRRALAKGYVAQKCDIVGHSMGGILTRLYLQEGGDTSLVNRIITANTPHSGSEFGDAVMAHPIVMGAAAMMLYKWKDPLQLLLGNIDAVRDLAVESDAIKDLNSVVGPESGIHVPVHALATQSNMNWATNAFWFGMGELSTLAIKRGGWFAVAGIIAKYFTHIFQDDLSQIGNGDMIVSTPSQEGGCKAKSVIGDAIGDVIGDVVGDLINGEIRDSLTLTNGPWHVNSPSDPKVINKVMELLTKGSSKDFSTEWFKPTERHFDHNAWLLHEGVDLAIDFIPGGEFLEKFWEKGLLWTDQQLFKIAINEIFSNNHSKGVQALAKGVTDDTDTGDGDGEMKRRTVSVSLQPADTYSDPSIIVNFGEDGYYMIEGYEAECEVPSTFSGKAYVYVSVKGEDGNLYITGDSITIERPLATPVSISAEEVFTDVGGEESLRLHCTWSDGSETQPLASNMAFETSGIASYADGYVTGISKGYTEAIVSYAGLTCNTVVRAFAEENDDNQGEDGDDDEDDEEQSDNVCSTVTLSFKQDMVMTRKAFRGTLTVNNGHKTSELKDVKLQLEVRDEEGTLATSHEFQINAESLKGFEGDTALTAGWTLKGDSTGVATILFIPTKYAAPTEDKFWSFGGSFSYIDPTTGLTVTHDLYPVTLTVKPSPNLRMDYFMQRDVMGDDPLTENITEPMEPAEFSLLINNIGNGDATNVRMVTHQPEIVDNEKGLLIDFELLSSQLNGGDKTLALGESVATEFGTIPANSTTYAQWWFTSTLLGHFSEYDVTATHVSSYGNPDLSLLDTVRVHELIHGFTVKTDDDKPLRGFLVNDIKDKDDLPDEVYFTDASQQRTYIATNANIVKQSDTEYVLNVTASNPGWNYGSLIDPTYGRQKLVKVTRADGTEVNVDNIWQTGCTLRDGKDPLYEKRLHFVGNMSADGETFYLTFEQKSVLELEISASPLEGGTVSPSSGSYDYGSDVTLEAVSAEGYHFVKWSNGETANPYTFTVSEDTTLVAEFALDSHTMTFVLDNGEENVVKTQDYASELSAPADPTKTGFTFKGWSPEVPKNVPASDQTFTAQWERNSYKLTWDVDGEKTENMTLYEAAITKPADPEKEGYSFAGWTPNVAETMPAEDVTYTANWTVNQYSMTFVLDNGEDNVVKTQDYASELSAPADPTKTGFTFKDWSPEVPETVPASDQTFTAQWEVNSYTIIYVVNGEEWLRETLEYGEPIILREYPAESGVDFSGWTSDADYEFMPAHDVTYSASATTGIVLLKNDSQLVDVYDLHGRLVLSRVHVSKLAKELPNGIYIINGNKVRIAK